MATKETFSKRRMFNIFRDDGRTLIIAMDHGAGLDVYPSLANPGELLDEVVAGGADAVLTTYGIAKNYFRHIKHLGLIVRVDGGSTQLADGEKDYQILYSVEDALAVGADAIACMAFPGSPYESRTLANVSGLAGECNRWGLPLMVEAIPGGFADTKLITAENLRLASRVAVELGADFVKTMYTGDKESFGQVAAGCYRPIVVLGGMKMDSDRKVLGVARDAIDAGASGVAFGRNVWQHADPRTIVLALASVIHQGTSVEEALELVPSRY